MLAVQSGSSPWVTAYWAGEIERASAKCKGESEGEKAYLGVLDECVSPTGLELVQARGKGARGLLDRDVLDRLAGDVEARALVHAEHRPGSSRRALLDVAWREGA